jgi:CheY-like chemotaxis protein
MASEHATPSEPAKRPLVLVVDDDPTVRMLARLSLGQTGFGVIEAEDGAVALEAFERARPDLVLLDVHMPRVDGYELCTRLRKTQEGATRPILMMTAPEDTDAIHRAFEVGATDFVTKPINWVLLGYRVRYALRDATRLLLEVARTVSSTLDLPEVLRRTTREVVRLVRADTGGAWLLTADHRSFSPVAAYRAPKDLLEVFQSTRYPAASELVSLARKLREPLFIADARADSRCTHPVFQLLPHVSLLVLPLWAKGDVRGAVVAAWRSLAQPAPEELRLAEAIVRQAQVAFENALLHADVGSRDEQLRQSQKMEAIGRLAGGIAHDFNNLLAISLIQAELLLRQFVPGDPRRQRVEDILAATERASALTRQLLAFSRKQAVTPTPLDLSTTVTGLGRMLERVLGESVEVVLRTEPDPWLTLADPGQVEQIVLNLAINARDAMPEGGQLTLETRNVTVDPDLAAAYDGVVPGDYAALVVQDTGIGMDQETRQRLFEPFFTTKEPGKGTGLGLATVYGIVNQAGGFIRVETAPGRGSAFHVHFPRLFDRRRAAAAPAPSEASRGSERILLVEDQDGVRSAVTQALEEQGYHVLSAGSATEALQLTESAGSIDLLLTDVIMPGMNGIELSDRLRTRWPRTRLLYMSGYAADDVISGALARTHAPILRKPFAPAVLAARVREVLDAPVESPVS